MRKRHSRGNEGVFELGRRKKRERSHNNKGSEGTPREERRSTKSGGKSRPNHKTAHEVGLWA